MKRKIFYFSGTGNSLNAARIIAREIGGAELIAMHAGTEASAEDADIIGFVCPVYEWDVPHAVKLFVERLAVNPKAYIFMVSTYIAIHGRCFETIEALLRAKGAHLDYAKPLRCVASECIAYEPFPPAGIMVPRANRMAAKIGKEIAAKKSRPFPRMSFVTRKLYNKLMGPFLSVQTEFDKGFYTSDACTRCGLCQRICPLDNIELTENGPVWKHSCIGCNSCVVYCPTKAIQFKTPEAYVKLDNVISRKLKLPDSRTRYHHPDVSAADLMKSGETVSINKEQTRV